MWRHRPYEDCPTCHGDGRIIVLVKEKYEWFSHTELKVCWRCGGRGHLPMKATGEH